MDREHEDLTHEIIQVDVKGIMNGSVADIPLQKNDVLYIPSIHDLQKNAPLPSTAKWPTPVRTCTPTT